MTIDTSNLSPMLRGKLEQALDKKYLINGVTKSLRQVLDGSSISKSVCDGMMNSSRRHFNSLGSNEEQEAYMARLKAKRLYFVNDIMVPKIVYDAIQG